VGAVQTNCEKQGPLRLIRPLPLPAPKKPLSLFEYRPVVVEDAGVTRPGFLQGNRALLIRLSQETQVKTSADKGTGYITHDSFFIPLTLIRPDKVHASAENSFISGNPQRMHKGSPIRGQKA
jgi:hypothetical protein